jgi:glucose-1-phosphate adenylyltransferase
MKKSKCIAMLLAGGQGTRLGILTRKLAKPAVPFGGKYRIIDFTLSNCSNSGIYTVGVLTQYQPLILNSYIGIGSHWDLDRKTGGVVVLPPYVKNGGGSWYSGTANAVYQNIDFIDYHQPENVLILSGDHIYKMDYSLMLDYHMERNADATIAVIKVPWEETDRFGIMNTDEEQRVVEFEEKPKKAKNNLASMGVYIFKWEKLRKYLIEDKEKKSSSHDFGKNIIPNMLNNEEEMFAYPFEGYWKDVGTIESLWKANMDLLVDEPELDLYDKDWKIYSVNPTKPPQYISPTARITKALINEGCQIYGSVENSVIFPGVYIGEDSIIKNSVIMSDVKIGSGVVIDRAIVGEETIIEDNCEMISSDADEIIVLGENIIIKKDAKVPAKIEISMENCHEFGYCINKMLKGALI